MASPLVPAGRAGGQTRPAKVAELHRAPPRFMGITPTQTAALRAVIASNLVPVYAPPAMGRGCGVSSALNPWRGASHRA